MSSAFADSSTPRTFWRSHAALWMWTPGEDGGRGVARWKAVRSTRMRNKLLLFQAEIFEGLGLSEIHEQLFQLSGSKRCQQFCEPLRQRTEFAFHQPLYR